VWLSGAGSDVLEVGVVVQHYGAMVLGHRGGQQVDDAGGAVVAPCGHAQLDLACPLHDRLADRQPDIQAAAAFGDEPGDDVADRGWSLRACAEVSIRESWPGPTGIVTDVPAA
jgi:hypothetical protein